MHLDICGRKKAIDKKKKECWGQNGTLRCTAVDGEGGDDEPSTITEIESSERKLDVREQSEGGKVKEGSLEIRPRYQTLSKAFEISRPTTKDSPSSHKEAPTFVM